MTTRRVSFKTSEYERDLVDVNDQLKDLIRDLEDEIQVLMQHDLSDNSNMSNIAGDCPTTTPTHSLETVFSQELDKYSTPRGESSPQQMNNQNVRSSPQPWESVGSLVPSSNHSDHIVSSSIKLWTVNDHNIPEMKKNNTTSEAVSQETSNKHYNNISKFSLAWSFGCLMWQIFNPEVNPDDVNLTCLDNIPENLKTMFKSCLSKNAKKRPSPENLQEFLLLCTPYSLLA